MAAVQCSLNGDNNNNNNNNSNVSSIRRLYEEHQQNQQQQRTFVSSHAYYGYVPVVATTPAAVDAAGGGDFLVDGMDVDGEELPRTEHRLLQQQLQQQQQQQLQQQLQHQQQQMMQVRSCAEEDRCCRKRCFEDDLAVYVPKYKRLREEAVVTNVFSMVQETTTGPKNVDWPRCTMSRYYA